MSLTEARAAEIVAFWRAAGPDRWFARDLALDAEIRRRFESDHLEAARGCAACPLDPPERALALVLLLDQIPRHLYRGSAHAFATDGLARTVAARALAMGCDGSTEPLLRPFFYVPFQHSEDGRDQLVSLRLFEAHARNTGDAVGLSWARRHAAIIERFGRFPHRNPMLGRTTTAEEQAWLDGGGFAG